MKYFIQILFFLFFVNTQAKNPIKIGIISDIHFLSETLMNKGTAMDNYISSTGRNIDATPAVIDKVLNEYLHSDIEVLLICGDITKDGEKESHIDFADKLKPLKEKGIKICVIPGNHDINIPNPVKFTGSETAITENISPLDFETIYKDFGYGDALYKDATSLSYVSTLNEKTWMLAIDAARYNEYTNKSISSGIISESTEKWILDIFDKAKKNEIQLVGMMHWGITEHIMYQASVFREYLISDWEKYAAMFADNGMKVIFTGHFHSNDISVFTSNKGNKIYDIETGTLSSYPYSYRFAELTSENIKIKTEHIISVENYPNLAETSKQKMEKMAQNLVKQKLKNFNIGLPSELNNQLSSIIGHVFILHAYGDEQISDSLRQTIRNLASSTDNESFISEDTELDFYPADNNVEIIF